MSAAAAARLLIRLRLRRLTNILRTSPFRRRKKDAGGARTATARKRLGWFLPVVVFLAMLVGSFALGAGAIGQARLHHEGIEKHDAYDFDSPVHGPVERDLQLIVALVFTAALCMNLGSRELATPEWDLEWLVTLPIPRPSLLAVRVAERTLVNPPGFLMLWPLLTLVALQQGAGWLAPAKGLAMTLPLLVLMGALHVLLETGARVALPPARLRNLQAALSVVALLLLYLVMSAGQPGTSLVHGWSTAVPAAFAATPAGLAVTALRPGDLAGTLVRTAALWAMSLAFVAGTVLLLARVLRDGIVTAGARESGRGAAPDRTMAKMPLADRRWLTPLQARELTLLRRDRAFLVQTCVMPVIILGAQFLFSTRMSATMLEDPRHVAAVAFGMMAYALIFSAFQALGTEGQALWMLYTLPRSLEQVLREKARLWSVVALAFPALVFGLGLWITGGWGWEALGAFGLVALGVPIYATIATCLGVFGTDPLEQDQRRRVRPGWAYLYMLLSSLYVYALYARDWWESAALVVLAGALALSLWQKARDRLPYLLDPTEAPPAAVSLADGMMSALVFFVAQALAVLALHDEFGDLDELGLLVSLAYALAAAVTFLGVRGLLAWSKARGVPRTFGSGRNARALGWGLLLGLLGAALSAAYVWGVRRTGLFREEMEHSVSSVNEHALAIGLLAIVAAPLFEEFLFRGLIHGGLRRSLSPVLAALASAAIFAVVHPPVSMAPVFVLGLLTALAYERTGLLLAPILVHALFNAGSVGAQHLLG